MTESVERFEKQLSIRELERLIFLTFMHSQGSPELQEMLNEWIASVYGVQDEAKVREAYANVLAVQFDSTEPNAKLRLAQNQKHVPVELNDAKGQVSHLSCLYTMSTGEWEDDEFLQTIFNEMLRRDKLYIYGAGRPNRTTTDTTKTHSDKYFSFIKTYLSDRTPTGDVALDMLYKNLNEWAIDKPAEELILHLINEQEIKEKSSND